MATRALRIVILDDSGFALELMSETLREAGFSVRAVSSVPDFEHALERELPDLILSDIQLPEVSGDNVCRLLKHMHETKSIPIVLYSTLADEELAQLAARAGADAWVSKRAGAAGIAARIEELVAEIAF